MISLDAMNACYGLCGQGWGTGLFMVWQIGVHTTVELWYESIAMRVSVTNRETLSLGWSDCGGSALENDFE
jgi:hypothetical protein